MGDYDHTGILGRIVYFKLMPTLHYRLRHYLSSGSSFHLSRAVKSTGDQVPLHDHDYAEVFWISGNPCWHEVNGVQCELPPGELTFIRPTDAHGFRASRRRTWIIHNIAFPEEIWTDLNTRLKGQRLPYQPDHEQPTSIHLNSAQLERLNANFAWLTTLPNTRLTLEWFLYGILVENMAQYAVSLPPDAPDWLVDACKLISAPENFALGPRQMAKLAGRSPEHLARTVREVLGVTPGDLITQLRMQYACRQLEFTNNSVQTIARDCGLANLSYFYRLFFRKFGKTPAAWRNECRRENPI